MWRESKTEREIWRESEVENEMWRKIERRRWKFGERDRDGDGSLEGERETERKK